MRIRLLLAIGLVVMGVVVRAAPPAHACVCGGNRGLMPLDFEGTATGRGGQTTMGRSYRFVVTHAQRGTRAGDTVEAALSVPELSADGTVIAGSSCDIRPTPAPGQNYRVTAYEGVFPDRPAIFFANQCGGSIELLSAATTAQDSGSSGNAALVGIAAAVTVAGLLTFYGRPRQSSSAT